jgi:hypothetical protein
MLPGGVYAPATCWLEGSFEESIKGGRAMDDQVISSDLRARLDDFRESSGTLEMKPETRKGLVLATIHDMLCDGFVQQILQSTVDDMEIHVDEENEIVVFRLRAASWQEVKLETARSLGFI